MRHRGRALLAGPERLLDLAYLGALEVADLGGEALEPGARDAIADKKLGVAIARHHLSRHVLARETKALEHQPLELGPVGRVRAHRAGQRAHRHLLHRALEAAQVALGLEREARELHAERGGLGMHAVGAAHAERAAMGPRLADQGVAVVQRAADQDQPGGGELERQRSVEHVG